MGGTAYFDIESVPIGWEDAADALREGLPPAAAFAEWSRFLEAKKPPKNYGEEKRREWWAERNEAANAHGVKWFRDGSLDPKRGMVLCAGLAFDDEPVEVLWEDGELKTLELLCERLDSRCPARIVAHFGRQFDFPFAWERAAGWRLFDLARWFAPAVHWRQAKTLDVPEPLATLVDTHDLWQTTRGSSGKLQDLARFLGVAVPNPIHGGQVLDAMMDGKPELVRDHVAPDVEVLRAVWRVTARCYGIPL